MKVLGYMRLPYFSHLVSENLYDIIRGTKGFLFVSRIVQIALHYLHKQQLILYDPSFCSPSIRLDLHLTYSSPQISFYTCHSWSYSHQYDSECTTHHAVQEPQLYSQLF